MRMRIPWVPLCAALAAGACASGGQLELVNRPPNTSKACADWRWIGIRSRSAQACPVVPGWKATPLFRREGTNKEQVYAQQPYRDEKPARDQLSTTAVVAELERFCIYQTEDPRADASDLPFPPAAKRELVRFDQDCAALSIAADPPLPASVWKPASALFLAQAGKPEAPLEIENEKGVRLAFLDTQPTGIGVPAAPGNSLHGYTLTHMARHLVCSPETNGRCAAQITTRLALPLTHFDAESRSRTRADLTRGGLMGMQSDLAEAISSEVDDWLRERPNEDAPQHLVLNLSLAWDPRLFGGLAEEQIAELRAGTQAVYRALQYAASLDVLVLAAAGNQKTCPGVPTDGPLLPAAWETGAQAENGCAVSGSGPLVYAVGGLQADGNPLSNARPGGMPPRAAYGEHAVVPTFDDDRPTAMYTGSSVATAVASSIAAVVWDTLPGLRARGVMDLLEADTSRNVLPRTADFWAGAGTAAAGAPPRVHRLSLCDALEQACSRPEAITCPLRSPCGKWPPAPVLLAGIPPDPVGGGTCQPWVFPAPEDLPCPNCVPEPPR